jgi:hypothetical protein
MALCRFLLADRPAPEALRPLAIQLRFGDPLRREELPSDKKVRPAHPKDRNVEARHIFGAISQARRARGLAAAPAANRARGGASESNPPYELG